MNPTDIIRHMIKETGKTAVQASADMDRGTTFITSTLNRRSSPRIDTFASICEVFGYKVKVINPSTGDIVEVD